MANVAEGKFVTSLVMPHELRAEIKSITDKTGESFAEVVRRALTEIVVKEKELEAA